ncbi:MAG: carboxypeptidase regulatory-like domain-containing protein [Terracidiphilus sp.]|jgi:hypothetical protein
MNSVHLSRLASGALADIRACFIAIAFGLLLAGTPAAFAQSIFASLSGTVTDPTGAVVTGAKVDVQNEATKVAQQLVTNKDGYFSIGQLQIGTYDVYVIAKGFEKWTGTGIVLNGSDEKNVSISLKVGSESLTVEVSASAGQIDVTDSGAKSVTITSEDLEKLPMIGANATEILRTIPGAAQITQGGTNRPAGDPGIIGINGSTVGANAGGMSSVSINGQSATGLSINEDGQNVEDPGAPGAATPINPNPDMIAEVSILTSNYGADNAKGPVVINSLSKSGGSSIHGDAHIEARNSALNSEEAYSKLQEVESGDAPGYYKIPSHYYYPGFDVGGPVMIPHTKFNGKGKVKLFFHESFEDYLQLIDGGIDTDFVPTANMIQTGDFSALGTSAYAQAANRNGGTAGIPTTPGQVGPNFRPGCAIAGGVMNKACIDPNAQLWLQDSLPAPNLSAPNGNGFNYVQPVSESQDDAHNMAKIDINFSDNTKAYITWSHQQETAKWPLGLWTSAGNWTIPAPSPVLSNNTADLYTLNFLHIFSPSLTVEGRVGYTHEYMPGAPQDPSKVLRKQMGFPLTGVFGNPNAPIATSWSGSIPNIGDIGHDYHPTFYAEKGIPSTGADLTKVYKTHTMKFGFLWENIYNAQDAWAQYQGVFAYGPWSSPSTGNNYADMLMGANQGYFEQALPPTMQMEQKTTDLYATDHWKLNRHMTLDYGFRFSHFGAPFANIPWGLAALNPAAYATQASAGAQNPGLSWYSLNPSTPLSGTTESFLVYSPRFGAAIDVFGNSKTVVRGGWGEYRYGVNLQTYQGAANTAAGSVGWSAPGVAQTWEEIDQFKDNGTSSSCAANAVGGIDAGNNHCAPTIVYGIPSNFQNSSLTVADTRNHDQPYTVTYSLSIDQQLPDKFITEISYMGSHSNLGQQSPNMNSVPVGAMTASAVTSTCSDLDLASGPNPTNILNARLGDAYCQQRFRPYPYYQTVNAVESSQISQYDSLQAQLNRSVGWATLNFNYAFSKNLGNTNESGAFKDWGEHEYWSPLNINRAQVFNATYVLMTPKMSLGNPILRGAANGWQLSGITQLQSGAMLTAVTNYQFELSNVTSAAVLAGSPDVTIAPVLTCDPKKGLAKGQYANPSCFAAPTGSSIGNARFPYLAGPKYWNSDLALQKSFAVKEQQHLDVRFSAFDFMNHALPSFVGGDSNLTASFTNGVLSNATSQNGKACPGIYCDVFGYADVHFGQRRLEFSAKYSF